MVQSVGVADEGGAPWAPSRMAGAGPTCSEAAGASSVSLLSGPRHHKIDEQPFFPRET